MIVLTQLPTPNDKRFLSVHKGNLDGLLLEKAEYLDRIQKYTLFPTVLTHVRHSFLEVVTCFLKGTPYCLLDKLDATYKPDPSVVFPAVETVVTRDWEMAKKYFDKGMIPRGKIHLPYSSNQFSKEDDRACAATDLHLEEAGGERKYIRLHVGNRTPLHNARNVF